MWTRAQLKSAGKENFKRVYAQAVIVSLIILLLSVLFDGNNSGVNQNNQVLTYNYNVYESEVLSYTDSANTATDGSVDLISNGITGVIYETAIHSIDSTFGNLSVFVILFVGLGVFIITLLIRMFIYYPIMIGKNKFFMGIRETDRKVGDIFFLFDRTKIVNPSVTMFLIDLYVMLWTLLLIIPGIVKSYEYAMIPYILSENPDIERSRAFELSKEMMHGQKWDTFVLDLSFIGWDILSAITFGLLGIFYVNPYREATIAELYAVLREDAIDTRLTDQRELPGFNLNV